MLRIGLLNKFWTSQFFILFDGHQTQKEIWYHRIVQLQQMFSEIKITINTWSFLMSYWAFYSQGVNIIINLIQFRKAKWMPNVLSHFRLLDKLNTYGKKYYKVVNISQWFEILRLWPEIRNKMLYVLVIYKIHQRH